MNTTRLLASMHQYAIQLIDTQERRPQAHSQWQQKTIASNHKVKRVLCINISVLITMQHVHTPHSWMLRNNLSTGDFCCCPEKVSQRLTIRVWKVSTNGVGIRGFCSCCCIPKFNSYSSSLRNDNASVKASTIWNNRIQFSKKEIYIYTYMSRNWKILKTFGDYIAVE